LSLALDAYAGALQVGFTMPESCQHARDQWRLEADQVAQFVEAECEPDPLERMEPQKLFNAYRAWAQENGIHRQLTQKSFSDRLKALGYDTRKSNGKRYTAGLKCHRATMGVFSHAA
jgi:putative DNA primase/helicase